MLESIWRNTLSDLVVMMLELISSRFSAYSVLRYKFHVLTVPLFTAYFVCLISSLILWSGCCVQATLTANSAAKSQLFSKANEKR